MVLLLTAPNGDPGANVELLNTGQNPVRALIVDYDIATNRVSPVWVEDYMPAAGNDFRTATRNAWLANPDCTWFIYPSGSYRFVGTQLTLADGYRNGVRHTAQNTEVYDDLGGVAGGQRIFFLRLETGATRAQNITWDGGWKFSLYNALTSYFGSAIYHESATNCIATDCEFLCTLVPAATTGRIRWGVAFLGGNAGDGGGVGNVVDRCRTTLCQILLCGQGRSCDGVRCTNIDSRANNDFCISAVSGHAGGTVRNVFVDGISLRGVAGGGCIFLGTDGAGAGIGATVVENITVSNVSIDGSKDPDLDFETAAIVLIDLGLTSQNIVVSNINTTLASTELQTTSVRIQSQDDEISSQGVTVSDCNLGIVTTNDPLEALFIQGHNLDRVTISNINVRGLRGVRILDCDQLSCSNVNTGDGGFLVQAESRNLTRLAFVGCNVRRTTGFNSALQFSSAANRSFGDVMLGDSTLQDNSGNGGLTLSTGAAAGTTRFSCSNVRWVVGTNPPNAATQAAIFRAVNCQGLTIVSTVVVAVPVVAAGAVGYVAVAMAAGTRLADLVVNEAVVACPQAQLVAAGAGGGFINARVSAAGTVEFAFLGPLAGGNANFSVARAAA